MLYTLLRSELKDEVLCENFLNHIANNIAYTGPFAVITAYCTYTIRKKDKKDKKDSLSKGRLADENK